MNCFKFLRYKKGVSTGYSERFNWSALDNLVQNVNVYSYFDPIPSGVETD